MDNTPANAFCGILATGLLLAGTFPAKAVNVDRNNSSVVQPATPALHPPSPQDARQQYELGVMYIKGQGVAQNDELALSWFKKSAQQNYPDGLASVGYMYRYGRGVSKNYQEAFSWFERAATLGHAGAIDTLGIFYFGALGRPQDCGKAIDWFGRGIQAGYKKSAANLSWVLATCPDAKYRNGTRALQIAREIVSNKTDPDASDWSNLAAAQAEIGNFDDAVKSQQRAIDLLGANAKPARLKDFVEHLNTYKVLKPVRQSFISE
jgi:TPR repeat protein